MSAARISLLLPTHGRAAELQRTLAGVWATVAQPDLLDVLICLDAPDRHTLAVFPFRDLPPMRVYRTDVRIGYGHLAMAINRLAADSAGDWLFPFADDVGCDTEGWDDVIRQYDHTVPTLCTCRNNRHNDFWFPLISRPAFEAMGCVSESLFNDIWLLKAFEALPANVHRQIPAHFTDRIVSPFSLGGPGTESVAEFNASAIAAGERLKRYVEAAV